ncbi:MAG: YDG domain-containing protein, partial [Synechococcaceae cyanobacterium ELA263]
MARRRRTRPAARQVQHWLPGLAGLVLLGLAGLVVPAARAGEITGTGGPLSLGTVVNGQLAGSCSAGLCTIGGGTGAGSNLFHRFSAFDTRGAIGGVLFQTQGHRNLVVGVMNPLGTVVDKAIQLSGPANLFWLSPGGISLGSGASFGNVQTLSLSTATGLRLGGGVFDVFGTTAAQAAGLTGDPLPGRAGLLTDPASLAAGGLAANGDLTLSGGLLTVDHSLLLDAQGGHVLLQAGQIAVPGGSVELAGKSVTVAAGAGVTTSAQPPSAPVPGPTTSPVEAQGGVIRVSAIGDAIVAGQLSAAGRGAAASSGATASGTAGQGGRIEITGQRVALTGAALDASGPAGGGTVLVGGGLQGGDAAVPNAQTTLVDGASSIRADATEKGKGGTVVVWADGATRVDGVISARGGAAGGDGGFVEVSSRGQLLWGGTVDARAPLGSWGTLLLDPYNITIANTTQTTNPDFTPTSNNSVINTGSLISALNSSNVVVSTGLAGSSGFQDGTITLADALSWSSSSILTLEAFRAIILRGPIQAPTGGLTLQAGGAIAASQAITTGLFQLTSGSWMQYSSTSLPAFSANDFRLIGGSFLRAQGGSGISASPYRLTDIYGVQGMGSSAALRAAAYSLANDIAAAGTSAWNGGAGFVPVGNGLGTGSATFRGSLDGAGRVISGLTINRPGADQVGLIGSAFDSPIISIRDLGLENVSIVGNSYVGGLVGINNGIISGSYVTGSVSGSSFVGGLVGAHYDPGAITQSYSNASVNGVNSVGGLVGLQQYGSIDQSYASGLVRATGFPNPKVGGLVGERFSPTGLITNSYWDRESTGQSSSPGGGVSLSTIQMQDPKSFVGWNFGEAWTLANAPRPFLRGLQSQQTNIAELPTVDVKYSGVSYVYAGIPAITYTLSGFTPEGTPSFTYSDVPLNAGSYTFTSCCLSTQRQVVTSILPGTITISQADLTLSGGRVYDGTTTVSGSSLSASGVNGESFLLLGAGSVAEKNVGTQKLNDLGTLALGAGSIGALASNYKDLSIAESSYAIDKAPAVVTANSGSRVYKGVTQGISGFSATGLVGSDTSADLSGVSAGGSSRNAGTYATQAFGTAQNYQLSFVDGLFTINQAPLTISAATDSRVYNGTTSSSGTPTVTSGQVFSGDTLSGLSQAFASKNVLGTNQSTLNVSGYSLIDGNSGNNYVVSLAASTGTISPLALSGAAIAPGSSTYGSALAPGAVSFANILGSDAVSSSASVNTSVLSTSGKPIVGSYTQSASGLTGADANNYSFSGFSSTPNYSINPLALTGAAIAPGSSTYGSALAPGAVSFANIFGSDAVGSSASVNTGALSSSGNPVFGSYSQSASALTGTDASNYSFSGFTSTPNYSINKLALSGAAIAAGSSTYGSALAPGAVSFANIVGIDALGSSASVNTSALSTSGKPVAGSYSQSASALSGADAANYSFSAGFTTATDNYTISKLALSGAAIAAGSSIYGSALNPGAVSFGNIVGIGASTDLVGSSASVNTSALSTSAKPIAGSYSQSASALTGVDAANYSFSGGFTTATPNYSINKLALSGAAIAPGSSTYGSSLTPGAVSFGNIVGTDASTDLVGSNASVNTSALSTSGKPVAGSYSQSASALSGADAANYSFSGFTSTPNYTISKLALSGAGITIGSSIYGSALNPGAVSFGN